MVVFPNGFRSAARVLRTDRNWDLAALAIWRPLDIAPVPISPYAPRYGDTLTIAGYGPGWYRAATGRCAEYVSPSANFPAEMVEVTVSARQGDSGGPILNSRGEIAGVLFGTGDGRTTGSYGGRVRKFLEPVLDDFCRLSPSPTMIAQQPPPVAPPPSGGPRSPLPAAPAGVPAQWAFSGPPAVVQPAAQATVPAMTAPAGVPPLAGHRCKDPSARARHPVAARGRPVFDWAQAPRRRTRASGGWGWGAVGRTILSVGVVGPYRQQPERAVQDIAGSGGPDSHHISRIAPRGGQPRPAASPAACVTQTFRVGVPCPRKRGHATPTACPTSNHRPRPLV